MEEIELELPPPTIPERPLNVSEVAGHLCLAMKNTLAVLRTHHPRLLPRVIHRPTDDGWQSGYMNLPRLITGWEGLEEAFRSGTAGGFTDYLWDHGANRRKLRGPAPDKAGWAYFTAFTYVGGPLMRYVEDALVNAAVDRLDMPTLLPPAEGLERYTGEIVDGICRGMKKVRVVYLHVGLELEERTEVELVPGIRVRRWSRTDYCRFLSLIEEGMETDDPFRHIMPSFSDSFVEVSFEVPIDTGANEVMARAVGIADRLRLALTLTDSRMWSIGERVVYVVADSPFGNREVYRIRRDAQYAWSPIKLDSPTVTQVGEKLRLIDYGLTQIPSLGEALFRYRRACTAELLDDQIVEAVIGLESLLVPNAGETRYRFALHGTAILAQPGDDPQVTFKRLGKMYDARSGRVHGAGRRQKDDVKHVEAVVYLARAIEFIITAHASGKLPRGDSAAHSVEKLVLERVTGSART